MRLLIAFFLAVLILPNLEAQVVIKSTVSVSPLSNEVIGGESKSKALQELTNPSLIQLDFNKYLVLRSGNVSFRPNKAQTIPGYTLDEDSVMVTIFKPQGLVDSTFSKAYSDKLIAPYLETNRFGTDSVY